MDLAIYRKRTNALRSECIFWNTYIFGKTTPPASGKITEHLVPRTKLLYAATDLLAPSRYIGSEYPVPRFAQAKRKRDPSQQVPVPRVDGRRTNCHKYLVIPGT